MLLGVDGVSDFNGCTADDEVEFYAFDMLVSDGEDIAASCRSACKANLSRLPGAPR